MLQFLQVARWENDVRAEDNLKLIIMIEDGTYEMANHLAKIIILMRMSSKR